MNRTSGGREDPGGRRRLGVLTSHVIQYQAPLFRELAARCDLKVFFAHRQSPQAQAAAGYGVPFEWDVDLLSGYSHEFLTNVARRPNVQSLHGCDTPEIGRKIEAGRFDGFLIMGWHLKCYWQAIQACKRVRVPVMVRGDSQLGTPRGRMKQAVKSLLYPRIIRQFDALLYVGCRNREYLEHYGAKADRMFFSPHCVDAKSFAAGAKRADRTSVRASWGASDRDRVILFVGRLAPRKRPSDLVMAAALLRARGTQTMLVWAGDGPERSRLESLGASLKVPMKFLGFCNQSRLPQVYGSADVLALPSSAEETWGLVVNEAMACGTPCVVSDACGCAPDMIVPGSSGEVFPVSEIEAFSNALSRGIAIGHSTEGLADQSRKYSPSAAAEGALAALASMPRCIDP